jgi:3'-phosphoadenosine 5'-phosphosulfate sulfotransferase (PAPS reductase)/FAD synthetase
MNAADLITLTGRGRIDLGVATDRAVDLALHHNAAVAIGVSGGKDSCALAFATVKHLNAIGHTGQRVLVHSDLGRVEWKDSLPTCERLAAQLSIPLVVVRRKAGDMMDRWLVRWSNNVERYADLSCVKVILPWSTPSMRFCTSELKTAVICSELKRRFPGQTIVSASGIRRQESSKRKLAPISKPQPKIASRKAGTAGLDWHPIIDWTHADVFASLASYGFELHEAYTKYGMSRVSCAWCIMSNDADKIAAATCPDNHDLYREMVALEIRSTFAFQGNSWLGDVAPHLLDPGTLYALQVAKFKAQRREQIEARIPKHLLYTAGWPNVMPTPVEADMLAEVRCEIAELLGLTIGYVTGGRVTARYAELMAAKEAA